MIWSQGEDEEGKERKGKEGRKGGKKMKRRVKEREQGTGANSLLCANDAIPV